VTEVKSGPGFQRAEGSRLVAVMRRNGALAQDYARRHDVPRWYDDAEALIHDPEVDAVSIATPPGSHLELALKVCEARKPAYVEKPMARHHAECRAMIAAFAEAEAPLFVAFYRRGLPRFLKVKELVETGALGVISGISYRYASPSHLRTDPQNLPWRFSAEHSGGGLFLDLGCHTLDILDFILGPLQAVSGTATHVAAPYAVEDGIVMRFRTVGGAPGTAAWNFASAVHEDVIEITGTEGRVTLSTFGNEPLLLRTAQGEERFDLPNPPHIQQPLIQTIVDELQGRGVCPSTGVTAARTAAVMDAVLTDYYGSREDAFWTRPETWPGRATDRE
jgi:predicted dehydrogenase